MSLISFYDTQFSCVHYLVVTGHNSCWHFSISLQKFKKKKCQLHTFLSIAGHLKTSCSEPYCDKWVVLRIKMVVSILRPRQTFTSTKLGPRHTMSITLGCIETNAGRNLAIRLHKSIWTASAGRCVFSRSTTLPPSFTVNSGIVNHTHSRMGSIMSTGIVQGMSTPRVHLCPYLHFMQCSPTLGVTWYAYTFTFRAFSWRFYPKWLTISTFVRRRNKNISLSVQ